MSYTLGEIYKVCGFHYFVTIFYFSLETLSAAIKTVVSAYHSPQRWEFDSKWRPRGGEIDL